MTRQINLDSPRAWVYSCGVCGNTGKIRSEFAEHHIEYFPERKITVCHKCHSSIHRTSKPELHDFESLSQTEREKRIKRKKRLWGLKPPQGDSIKFYGEESRARSAPFYLYYKTMQTKEY